jgi:hypothetical protein
MPRSLSKTCEPVEMLVKAAEENPDYLFKAGYESDLSQ